MPPLNKRFRILSTTLSVLSVLCGGALLPACSTPPAGTDVSAAAAPSAEDSYQHGRSLHLARRHDEAIAAYRQALLLDAGHANAGNGLAIAYAERREFARAIPIWRELTRGATMSSGPAVAFLFGNLGHAYLLNGELDEAVAALEKACLLDPLNERAWQHLGQALQGLGQEERAQQMLRQASALREHDLRADYAVVQGERPAAIAQALAQRQAAAPGVDREWAFAEVARTGNGMFELRRLAAGGTRKAVAAAPVAPLPAPDGDRMRVAALEISNGNGRQGMARMLSRQLRDPGLKIVRLTNEKGFAVRQTRIEYRAAFRGVAERLAQRYAAGIPVPVDAGRVDVRLVLGRDLTMQRLADRSRAVPASPADRAGAP